MLSLSSSPEGKVRAAIGREYSAVAHRDQVREGEGGYLRGRSQSAEFFAYRSMPSRVASFSASATGISSANSPQLYASSPMPVIASATYAEPVTHCPLLQTSG